MPRSPRSRAKLAEADVEIVGWSVAPWSAAVGHSTSKTYELLKDGIIDAYCVGGRTVITTTPLAYIKSFPKWKPGIRKLRGGVDPLTHEVTTS